jgi:hypothetical protein
MKEWATPSIVSECVVHNFLLLALFLAQYCMERQVILPYASILYLSNKIIKHLYLSICLPIYVCLSVYI